MTVLADILHNKVVSIIRGVPSKNIVDAVSALAEGGVRCVEITFNPADPVASTDTLRSIEKLKTTFGDKLHVGAGTVLTANQVDLAAAVGAEFMISPNVSQSVIMRTKALGLVSMPGAYTPTEAQQAHEYGADIIKIFPADCLGVKYFQAIKAPLSHLRFAAVGGVNTSNIADFLAIGVDAFGIGGNLVNSRIVKDKNWSAITQVAEAYMKAVIAARC